MSKQITIKNSDGTIKSKCICADYAHALSFLSDYTANYPVEVANLIIVIEPVEA